jgi:hypothetical protein
VTAIAAVEPPARATARDRRSRAPASGALDSSFSKRVDFSGRACKPRITVAR